MSNHGLLVPFRDYEADRRAWERANRREWGITRFWVAWGFLAFVVALVLIFGCSGPAPHRSYSDLACELRDSELVAQDTTQAGDVR